MKLIDMIKELLSKKFYGSLTINFQHGKIANIEKKESLSGKNIVV